MVREDLRNIASIIQEEENQLKLVEKRTGEFQFDFSKMKSEEPSLIDEIDDAMLYWIQAGLVVKAGKVLGEDVEKYEANLENIRKAFMNAYLPEDFDEILGE